MVAHVIGVVRGATRLDELFYEVRDPVDPAAPWQVDHACSLRPLSRDAYDLALAWRALGAVTAWDATTLAHVLAILRATVPASEAPGDLPALGPEVHPVPPPRATAAHPRAYRGTRHRPPRPRQPDAVDLRPYLLARRHIDQVLELLGQRRGIDPFVAWHFGVDTASFDPAFVTDLLPLLRGCAWSEVGAFAALARTLDLPQQPELRAALVGVVLAADDPRRALGWWSHVLAHAPARRLEAAQLVAASGVAKVTPIAPEVAAVIAELEPVCQWSVYRALAGGASPAYLLSGLALGAISRTKVEDLPAGQRDVTATIASTIERLARAMEADSGAAFWRAELWRACGERPELVELLLARPDFQALEPAAAFGLVRLACSLRWLAEKAVAYWRALAPRLPGLVELTASIAVAYQPKFVELVANAYGSVEQAPETWQALPAVVGLCRHVSRAPFLDTADLDAIIANLVDIGGDAPCLEHLRRAPDASWQVLEQACLRVNDARIIGRGLVRVARRAPELLAIFATSPRALLRTADLLTTVSLETAEAVLARYATSRIAAATVADAPIEALCALVEPIARAGGPDPVRRALRRHLAGELVLGEAQIRGHRARIVADLGLVRLAAIRQATERALAARVGVARIESATVRHAVGMLGSVETNRRPLRRMIAANLAGDTDWTRRHPRTQAWFARHPRVDPAVWLAGIVRVGELAGTGSVTLAIELDPFEALKLGTYVGSCLGRGGGLEFSAAAVVLDINKQVVYARDARGAVVGRQLIAISDADELVCFSVYGTAKVELLEPLFREFDRALAAALGLPLLGSGDYEIAWVLSHEWWDDSAWREVVERDQTVSEEPS